MTDNSTVSSVNQSKIPHTGSTDSSRNFNDSLERMEYMMKKGRELQEKSNTKTVASEMSSAVRVIDSPTSHYVTPTAKATSKSSQKQKFATPGLKGVTPASKTKLFSNSAKKPGSPGSQAITPATRILKPFNRVPSAKVQSMEKKFTSPIISPGFKKPNFPTSNSKKESAQTGAVSRIPTSKNKHFNHIVSPIGAYIKNIAPAPLLANVKPTSDFFDSSYCNKIQKNLDYSVVSDKGTNTTNTKPVPSLPVKFFSLSEQQRVRFSSKRKLILILKFVNLQIIDAKTQKIPGGEKLNRIIGQIPSVISHEGRIHSGSPIKRTVPVDDSFANMSVMSGDISVQVVRDVKRQ